MANYPNYDLYGKRPADTFRNIVQFNVTASNLVDSYGDDLPLTMSIQGTSSWANNAVNAVSASWAPDQTVTVDSSSWASQSLSASWAPFTDSGTTLVTGSTYDITASVAVSAGTVVSSSHAETASWAPFTQVEQISASWASQSLSASWAPGDGSGTLLTTGSTYEVTSSWSNNSVSASWAPFTQVEQISSSWASASLSASYAPFTQTEQVSASWASSSLSSSVAVSASWAPTSITYPLTVLTPNLETASIDFLVGQYFQLDTTASVFTFGNSTNVEAVRNASIYITAQSGSREIIFNPSWIVMGNFPTTIAHNSASVLSLTTFGADDTSIIAAFASKV